MSSLAGKCALITGSTQGLGLAAARHFAASGCHLVLNGLADARDVTGLRREIEDTHQVRTLFDNADLRDPAQIERMAAAAVGQFGAIDILVNNAVVRHTGAVEQVTTVDWDLSIAVNLSAAFHTIRAALPAMKRRRWGRIINVSSIYGLRGAAHRVGYVTSKTGLIGLTRAVAVETAGLGITCNAICPGTAETPIHDESVRGLMTADGLSREEAVRRVLAGKQPSGRLISPDAVAALMVFLCGDDGADITGAALPIDGAWAAS
jgi:3-hydroxybutyrate dehydrogenase